MWFTRTLCSFGHLSYLCTVALRSVCFGKCWRWVVCDWSGLCTDQSCFFIWPDTRLLMTHGLFGGLRLQMVQDQWWSDIRQPAGKMERVTLRVYLALFSAAFVVTITIILMAIFMWYFLCFNAKCVTGSTCSMATLFDVLKSMLNLCPASLDGIHRSQRSSTSGTQHQIRELSLKKGVAFLQWWWLGMAMDLLMCCEHCLSPSTCYSLTLVLQ